MREFFDEDGWFKSPEHAAAHAMIIQHGYSTPARECRRMLDDIRRLMMRCCEHCPDDCPGMLRCEGCGWTPRSEHQLHYDHAVAANGTTACMDLLPRPQREPHDRWCGQCEDRPRSAYERKPVLEEWLASRGLSRDGEEEPPDWSSWMKGWKP